MPKIAVPKIAGWKKLEQADRERAAKAAQRVPPEQQQDELDEIMSSVRDLSRFAPLGILVAVLAVTTSGWTPHAIALVAAFAVLGVLMLIVTAVWMRRR